MRSPQSIFLQRIIGLVFAGLLFLAPRVAVAQHGGGHAGGGHFGGGHAAAAPHPAPAPHPFAAAPAYRPLLGAPAGARIAPPQAATARPLIGTNRFIPGEEIWQSPASAALGQHRPARPFFGAGGTPARQPLVGPWRGGYPGYGWPFFNAGFGLGFGLGLGFGWGPTCGPYWGWGFGCNGLAYNDYGYAPYVNPPISNWPQSDYGSQPETPPPPDEVGTFLYESQTPAQVQANIQAEKFITMLYLTDGSVYALSNYWVEDGKLHYKTTYGGENTIPMDQVDIQKTVDVNAARGVPVTLRPKTDTPDSSASSPDANSPANPSAGPAAQPDAAPNLGGAPAAPGPQPPAPPQNPAPPSPPAAPPN